MSKRVHGTEHVKLTLLQSREKLMKIVPELCHGSWKANQID